MEEFEFEFESQILNKTTPAEANRDNGNDLIRKGGEERGGREDRGGGRKFSTAFSLGGNSLEDERRNALSDNKRYKMTHEVVCRHWLRGMCIKGDSCDFLHIFDYSRMPLCRAFRKHGRCHEHDIGVCPLRHDDPPVESESGEDRTTGERKNLCLRYLFGYCSSGPTCQQRHVKLPRSALIDAPLPDWYLHLVIAGTTCDRKGLDEAVPPPPPFTSETSATLFQPLTNDERRVSSLRWQQLAESLSGKGDGSSNFVPELPRKSLEDVLPSNSFCPSGRDKETINPGDMKIRAFVIKSGKIENILTSVQRGIWATGKANIDKLETAFRTCDQVLLLMSANESGGFQGYARMASLTDPSLYPRIWGSFSAKLSPNFRVQWLKQCKLDFEALATFTNPWNENKPLKKSRDGQVRANPL